jgi:hypothetical protein
VQAVQAAPLNIPSPPVPYAICHKSPGPCISTNPNRPPSPSPSPSPNNRHMIFIQYIANNPFSLPLSPVHVHVHVKPEILYCVLVGGFGVVWCCVVLYCIVLYCIVEYCIVLQSTYIPTYLPNTHSLSLTQKHARDKKLAYDEPQDIRLSESWMLVSV